VTTSGVLTTASDLLFVGGREGFFQALDARTGALLWKANLGGETAAGPMTYEVDGQQYIAIAAGHSLLKNGVSLNLVISFRLPSGCIIPQERRLDAHCCRKKQFTKFSRGRDGHC
jgi:glucose dehydrogenase